MSLLSELKRRNVLRMAALYIVAAWLVMQVAEVLMTLVNLPRSLGGAVLAVLVIGFPIAILLSWFYELTPTGLKLETAVDRADSITHLTGRRLDFLVISILLAALVVFALDKWWFHEDSTLIAGTPLPSDVVPFSSTSDRSPRLGPNSLVVLPFSGNNGQSDIYADGLLSEILTEFGKIEAITTIGRTTSTHYRGSDKPVQVIADELGVAKVLSGILAGESGQLRLNLELLDGQSGQILWAENYELRRNIDGAFRVQSAVVHAVAHALQVEISVSESAQIDDRQVPSELAYEHYLRGEVYRETQRWNKAVDEFRLATLEDPYFADAWAALAAAMADASLFGAAPVTIQQAESALDHARQLAPRSAGTLFAEATVLSAHNKFDAAVEKLNAMLELQPGAVRAMSLLSGVYVLQLRLEEARRVAERAVMIDPLSIDATWQLAFVLAWSWSFEDARTYYDRVLAFEPDAPHSWRFWMRYNVYLWGLGDTIGARQILDEAPSSISTLYEEIRFAYVKRNWTKLQELLALTEASSFTRHATEARLRRFEGDGAGMRASAESMRIAAEANLEALMRRGAVQADVDSARSDVAVALALAGNEVEAIRTIDIAVVRAAENRDRLNVVPVYANEVLTYTFLGRNEEAIERLRTLFTWARPPYLTVHRLRMDPDYDELRGHPDFELLLEELAERTN